MDVGVRDIEEILFETLATTVDLDTDIDLWLNDMSNIKHANIGTR